MSVAAGWTIRHGVPPDLAPAAARLYWQHFGAQMQPLPLSPDRGAALVRVLMRPDRALVATTPDGALLAIAGLRGTQGGLVPLHRQGFVAALGPLQGRLRFWVTALCLGGGATSDLVLDGVVVRRDWRGRGLGRALIAAAETQARHQGHPALRAEVAAGDDAALAAWQAMGFHPVRRQWLGWPWQGPAHVLRRPLPQA